MLRSGQLASFQNNCDATGGGLLQAWSGSLFSCSFRRWGRGGETNFTVTASASAKPRRPCRESHKAYWHLLHLNSRYRINHRLSSTLPVPPTLNPQKCQGPHASTQNHRFSMHTSDVRLRQLGQSSKAHYQHFARLQSTPRSQKERRTSA